MRSTTMHQPDMTGQVFTRGSIDKKRLLQGVWCLLPGLLASGCYPDEPLVGGSTLRFRVDVALEAPVATWWKGGERGESVACLPDADQLYTCQFSVAPAAEVGELKLLFGDAGSVLGQGGVWPVTFTNLEPVVPGASSTVLNFEPEADRPPLSAFRLVYDGGDIPVPAQLLRFEEAQSGLSFEVLTDEAGEALPGEDCAIWSDFGCWLPSGLTWSVSSVRAGGAVDVIGTWTPGQAEPLVMPCPDADGDGFGALECAAIPDCDDSCAACYPDALEITGDGIDQDCDGFDQGDQDGDGYLSTSAGGDDCDDQNGAIHPGAPDVIGDSLNANCSEYEDQLHRFAGVGTFNGYGARLETSFGLARGLALDAQSQLLISDFHNHQLRRITSSGTVEVVAGNQYGYFCGDEGAAEYACLYDPRSMVWGPDGALYVAEAYGNRIRRISSEGIISTVSGQGYSGFSGDGGDAKAALLDRPVSIVFDVDGSLIFADSYNHRIRKISTSNVIETIVGTGKAEFNGDGKSAIESSLNYPYGLLLDHEDRLLIADSANNRIRRLQSDNTLLTVAGTGDSGFTGDGGPAASATLSAPAVLVPDDASGYYFTEYRNHVVRHVDLKGTISTVAGSGDSWGYGDGGNALDAGIPFPTALLRTSTGELFVGSDLDFTVRRIGVDGIIERYAGNGSSGYAGDGGFAEDGFLNEPTNLQPDALGGVYIADAANRKIRYVNAAGELSTVVGTGASGSSGDGGDARDATLSYPISLAMDSSGRLLIADYTACNVRRIELDGTIDTIAGMAGCDPNEPSTTLNDRLAGPTDVQVASDGSIYVVDKYKHRVVRVLEDGVLETIAGTGNPSPFADGVQAVNANLNYPRAMEIDAQGRIYIAEFGGNRIRRIRSDGIIETVAGTGIWGNSGDGGPATAATLAQPGSLAFDSAGNLLLLAYGQVRMVGTDGIIQTLVGYGITGTGGENNPARGAAFYQPSAIAIDAAGRLFIADTGNHRVEVVDP